MTSTFHLDLYFRPWIAEQQGLAGANPLWDWPNNFNYMFIFVFGFGITAAEEHGVKESFQRGRWFYLVAGCIFSGFKTALPMLAERLTDGPYPWTYAIIDGTFK